MLTSESDVHNIFTFVSIVASNVVKWKAYLSQGYRRLSDIEAAISIAPDPIMLLLERLVLA